MISRIFCMHTRRGKLLPINNNKKMILFQNYTNCRFAMEACKLALGPDSQALKEGRAMGFQMCNGSGAQRIALEVLRKCLPDTKFAYVSKPTWLTYDIIIEVIL